MSICFSLDYFVKLYISLWTRAMQKCRAEALDHRQESNQQQRQNAQNELTSPSQSLELSYLISNMTFLDC